jgi:hemerythrin
MAEFLAWSDDYSVGNARIDSEHRRLFDLANLIFAIEQPKEQVDDLRRALHALYDYMLTHFDHEEAYMAEVAYPALETYRELHAELVNAMNEIMKTSRDYEQLERRLANLMRNWLLDHIMKQDCQIMSHVLDQDTHDV